MSMTTEQIKTLKELADDPELDMLCDWDGECRKALREAAETIETLSAKLHTANMERSSQYYHDGWILCEEKMPEEHEWVGTRHFGTTISDEVYVTFKTPDGKYFTKHLCFQNGELSKYDQTSIDVFYKGSVPIAWRPLSEPYQPNEEV